MLLSDRNWHIYIAINQLAIKKNYPRKLKDSTQKTFMSRSMSCCLVELILQNVKNVDKFEVTFSADSPLQLMKALYRCRWIRRRSQNPSFSWRNFNLKRKKNFIKSQIITLLLLRSVIRFIETYMTWAGNFEIKTSLSTLNLRLDKW